MRREFERASCVVLPKFLDSALLAVVQEQVACGLFSAVDQEGFGRDFPMRDNPTSQVLNFLFNDPCLLSAIRTLTGCRAIRSFGGSVRRAIAGAGNSLSWHSDAFRGRLVAITLNLGTEPYRGGFLQIRDQSSKRIIREVANTGSGDAVVFRISKSLEHRNSRILGKVAKTAFSGWFLETDAYGDAFEMRHAQLEAHSSDDARGLTRFHSSERVTASTRIAIPADIVWRRIGDGMVVVKASDGLCYRLDPVVWSPLNLQQPPPSIAPSAALRVHEVLELAISCTRGGRNRPPKFFQAAAAASDTSPVIFTGEAAESRSDSAVRVPDPSHVISASGGWRPFFPIAPLCITNSFSRARGRPRIHNLSPGWAHFERASE